MPRVSALTPAVQAAFVAALRGGALVEAAARSLGVAISSLYWRRHRDPLFAAAWDSAVALSAAAPGRRRRFAGARRARFLARFEASCNILMACRETGVHPATVYRHIGGDPGFERDCRSALARGTARLERELAARRAAEKRPWARHVIVPAGRMTRDFDEQMKLLARWTRPDGSIGPRFVRHGRQRRWSFDDAIALLAKRLKAMEPRWGEARQRRTSQKRGAPGT
jgi:transposase-like protein